MGCKSSYQVKILSKQLNFKRNFSTLVQISKLNPWFVTGFVDADLCSKPTFAFVCILIQIRTKWTANVGKRGSFSITIYIDNRIKDRLVWAVKPSFQISLNSKDINLLLQLKDFFGCGVIVNKNTKN